MNFFYKCMLFFLVFCLGIATPFIFSFLISFIQLRFFKKIKPIKNETKNYSDGFLLKRLLIDFPRQFAKDRLTFDPNTFREYGLHMVCGVQGSGKTTTVAYLVNKYKTIYPRLKVGTNWDCPIQDFKITDWKQLTLDTNGIYGELDCISEIQNWFSTNSSRNFPESMLSIVTQQRKVRRCIIADTQKFEQISIQLRRNTYLLYLPMTLFGCLTIVRVYEPVIDDTGSMKEKRLKKVFCFVHNDKIRNLFDSYEVVKSFSDSGFIEKSESNITVINNDKTTPEKLPPRRKRSGGGYT